MLDKVLFQIVVSKLRERTALDHDRRHLKAAKVILSPVLQIGDISRVLGTNAAMI